MKNLWVIMICFSAFAQPLLKSNDKVKGIEKSLNKHGLGHDVGNGGFATVCRDKKGVIQSAEFFDLWYAKSKHLEFSVMSSSDSSEKIGKDIVKRLYKADPVRFKTLPDEYINALRARVEVPSDFSLIPPPTYLGNLSFESDCSPEPLAVYSDPGVLFVEPSIWQVMENQSADFNLNEAAFYVHEALGRVLWKQALAKRKDKSTSLSFEERQQVAKNTVLINAHAFSSLTNRQLVTWWRRFKSDGQVYTNKRTRKINITLLFEGKKTSDKDKVGEVFHNSCDEKANEIEQKLGDKIDMLIHSCEAKTSRYNSRFITYGNENTGYYRKGVINLSIIPARMTLFFHDTVFGEFVDARESDTPEFKELMKKARQDHALALDQWIKDLLSFHPNHLTYVSFVKHFNKKTNNVYQGEDTASLKKETRVYAWEVIFGSSQEFGYIGLSSPIGTTSIGGVNFRKNKTRYLGSFSYNRTGVFLPVLTDDLSFKYEQIKGVKYKFHHPKHEDTERQATKLAFESWKQACADWKAKIRAGGKAVWVTCAEEDYPYRHTRVSKSEASVQYSSSGKIYYYTKGSL